mgnify:CR=1 FL=1
MKGNANEGYSFPFLGVQAGKENEKEKELGGGRVGVPARQYDPVGREGSGGGDEYMLARSVLDRVMGPASARYQCSPPVRGQLACSRRGAEMSSCAVSQTGVGDQGRIELSSHFSDTYAAPLRPFLLRLTEPAFVLCRSTRARQRGRLKR